MSMIAKATAKVRGLTDQIIGIALPDNQIIRCEYA